MKCCTETKACRRGAATLEGVVVAFFLITLFVCLVAIAGLYKTKLLVMHDARYLNMLNATNACEEEHDASEVPPPAEPPELPPKLRELGVDFVYEVLLSRGVSRIDTHGKFGWGSDPNLAAAAQHAPIWYRRVDGDVNARSATTCNEKAAGFDAAKVVGETFESAWKMFASDVRPILADLMTPW